MIGCQFGSFGELRKGFLVLFQSFVGKTAYDELARRRIAELGEAGELPFVPEGVGRAWTKDVELDGVARGSDGSVLVGEGGDGIRIDYSAQRMGPPQCSQVETSSRKT